MHPLVPLCCLLALALAPPDRPATGPPCGPLPGPEPPAGEPALLAPGWVNQGARTRDLAMTPDGREIYFCVMVGGSGISTILVTRRGQDGCWREPRVLPLAADPRWRYLEPHVAPDGQRLFFVTDQPAAADTSGPGGREPGDEDIWVARRQGDGWGPARPLPAPVNTAAPEFFPSVTRGGRLYFTRPQDGGPQEVILRARPDGQGGWQEPEVLPAAVNAGRTRFNAFVDPDERYLVVCVAGHPGNLGSVDYWLVARDPDDTWRGPVNLGPRFNGPGREGWSPYVSPDGRWFFFMSTRGQELTAPLTLPRLRRLHAEPGNGLGHLWLTGAAFLDDLARQAR